MEIGKRIAKLINTIKGHDSNYYILGEPSISKYEYEELWLELRELERQQELGVSHCPIHTSRELA